jgi:hypothetical protein
MNVSPLRLVVLGSNPLSKQCTLYTVDYLVAMYKFYVGWDLPEAIG